MVVIDNDFDDDFDNDEDWLPNSVLTDAAFGKLNDERRRDSCIFNVFSFNKLNASNSLKLKINKQNLFYLFHFMESLALAVGG